MPTPDETAALQALDFSQRCVDNALSLARNRNREIESHIRPAEDGLAAIGRARTELQGAPPPADLPPLITASIRASGDGLKKAGELLNAAVAVASNASALDEWKECRSTIDRCDKLLVDLRKTGFGFITAVVGAAAYVLSKPDHPGSLLKSYLLCSLVVLILVLYLVDLAHQSWLGIAVKRAQTLEGRLNFELTQLISAQFAASRATSLGVTLYMLLLLVSCLIFWASIPFDVEGFYTAARSNIYGALALGAYVIITAPWYSELASVGYAHVSRLAWRGLWVVTLFFVVLGILLDLFGPLNGVIHHYHLNF